MAIELKIPEIGESITEAEIVAWLKQPGDTVEKDEAVVELETDKATVELPAPEKGTLTKQLKAAGERVRVGDVIGYLEAGAPAGKEHAAAGPDARESAPPEPPPPAARGKSGAAAPPRAEGRAGAKDEAAQRIMPAARRALAARGLEAEAVTPSGPGGRLLKEDVAEKAGQSPARRAALAAPAAVPPPEEERVPMSPIRRTIARRLVEAQQTAALVSTFNEVDMQAVLDLRQRFRERFQEQYGVGLGLMSFFVKAVVRALQECPALNAEIRDEHIVYRNYYDIGIAVSTERGLVVPVLRRAEKLSYAEIETAIASLAERARGNEIELTELTGGTFTITNGGIFGSLLSTPIVNPPQSGILGMHAIQRRPVAVGEEIVVRPMMYLALTYDHRIVDGREAVTFLRRVKETIEEPARLLLDL